MAQNFAVEQEQTAQRRAWVTPQLRTLDVRQTLVGPIAAAAEGVYTEPPHTGQPNTHCDRDVYDCTNQPWYSG